MTDGGGGPTIGYLLLLELRLEEYLEDVILALTGSGAEGALVLDAVSMERMMAMDLPIFAGFREELTSEPGFAKLVIARTADPRVIDRFLEGLSEGGTDFQADGLGRLAMLPLAAYVDANVRLTPEGAQ